jgi:hypothetical protein
LEWPYKRGGFWLEWPYKRGSFWLEWPYMRGGFWLEWPDKTQCTTFDLSGVLQCTILFVWISSVKSKVVH